LSHPRGAILPPLKVLTFAVRRELRVADLTGSALNRLGTDANLFASNDYAVTQEWSGQLMIHAQARDGIRINLLGCFIHLIPQERQAIRSSKSSTKFFDTPNLA
jgi:hypothetical protein